MEDNKEVVTATTENAGVDIAKNDVINAGNPNEVQGGQEAEKKQEKLFTQKEVDEIIQKRLQRTKEPNDDLKLEVEQLKAKLEEKEHDLLIKDANVDEEYKDYVKFAVSKMVTKEKTFDTALKEFMATNGKKYEKVVETQQPTIKMTRPENVGNEEQQVAFENQLDKAMKLKK